VEVDPSVVDEQIAFTVDVLTVTRSVIDPHREAVNGVTVPVRGKVSRPLEVRPELVAPVIVDAARDIEPLIAVTVVVTMVVSVEPILAVVATVVTVEVLDLFVLALMPVVDSVPVIMATLRFDGGCEDESQQERAGGEDNGCDAFHGKASFDAWPYCQKRANSSQALSVNETKSFKINYLKDIRQPDFERFRWSRGGKCPLVRTFRREP
jgi:hypothetical protein